MPSSVDGDPYTQVRVPCKLGQDEARGQACKQVQVRRQVPCKLGLDGAPEQACRQVRVPYKLELGLAYTLVLDA